MDIDEGCRERALFLASRKRLHYTSTGSGAVAFARSGEKTMQGIRLVVPGPNQVRVEEYEIPAPGPTQVRVRTEASLVSAGTELAIYTGIHQGLTNPNTSWPKFPQEMGYMAVGRVD